MLNGDDRPIGKTGYMTFERENITLEPVRIPLTLWSLRSRKSLQDTTNSANYDPKSNLVYPTHSASAVATEGEIRGRLRISVVPSTIIESLYSGGAVPKLTFYVNPQFKYGSGYFLVSDFATESPYDGSVDFSASIRGYGFFDVNVSPWSGETEEEPPLFIF